MVKWELKKLLNGLLVVATVVDVANSIQPSANPAEASALNDHHHAAMLTRAEASILGESALLDRETGRVFWEGGSSNTLYESLIPKIDQYGAEHAHAVILSALLAVAFLGVFAHAKNWISSRNADMVTSFVLSILDWIVHGLPTVENRWLVLTLIILYLLESYNCNTRRFLANAISSTSELEAYIDRLREEQPIVTWNAITYHFELRTIFALPLMLRNVIRKRRGEMIPRSNNCRSVFPFTKKVISRRGTACYQYGRCDDNTIAGVWRRAEVPSIGLAPFTKIALSKILILSNRKSREDYFNQQSEFFVQNSRSDEFVQFSTNIEVPGYRPRMLAVRSMEGVSSAKTLRLHLFWLFTFFGLTVPYRIWFKRHCDFLRVSVVKETYAPDHGSKLTRLTPRKYSRKPGDHSFKSFMRDQSLYPKETNNHVTRTPDAQVE